MIWHEQTFVRVENAKNNINDKDNKHKFSLLYGFVHQNQHIALLSACFRTLGISPTDFLPPFYIRFISCDFLYGIFYYQLV